MKVMTELMEQDIGETTVANEWDSNKPSVVLSENVVDEDLDPGLFPAVSRMVEPLHAVG